MRLLVLLVLLLPLAGYEESRLALHVKVFSKILLLDERVVGSQDGIDVALLYEPAEQVDAMRLKRMLEEVPMPLPLTVTLVRYGDGQLPGGRAYFLLEASDDKKVGRVARHAIKEGIISYAYNYRYLEEGVMLSLRIAKQVVPVINPIAVREAKIPFQPILIRIAQRYEP